MLSEMARHDASVVGLRIAVSGETVTPAAVGTAPKIDRSSEVELAGADRLSNPKKVESFSSIASRNPRVRRFGQAFRGAAAKLTFPR